MNPFQVNPDQILDPVKSGLAFYHWDTHIEMTWMASFNPAWKPLEQWDGKTLTYFRRFFTKDS